MSHAIAIPVEMEFQPTRAEKLLYTFLTVLLLLPLAIFQYFLILLLNWMVYRWLLSIIKHYASLKLTSKDQEYIKAINSNLVKLSEPLQRFYNILCEMEKHKIFFVSSRVKGVAEMIDSYEDLVLAYNIFSEPVDRNYPVAEEFRNLRKGRKVIDISKSKSTNFNSQKDEFLGQIVFPTPR